MAIATFTWGYPNKLRFCTKNFISNICLLIVTEILTNIFISEVFISLTNTDIVCINFIKETLVFELYPISERAWNDVILVFLPLTLKIFHTLLKFFYCWFWASNCLLVFIEKLHLHQSCKVSTRKQVTFNHQVPTSSRYSGRKAGPPWKHPVILDTGPHPWLSITLKYFTIAQHQQSTC